MLHILVMIPLLINTHHLLAKPNNNNPNNNNIAYMNTGAAILATHEAKAERQRLQAEMKNKRTELHAKEQELQSLEQDFLKNGELLSGKEKLQKQQLARKKMEELQREQMQAQQYFQNEEAQSTKNIQLGLAGIAKEVALKNEYSVVLEEDALVFKGDAPNITDKVANIYNQRFPVKKKIQTAANDKKTKKPLRSKPLAR